MADLTNTGSSSASADHAGGGGCEEGIKGECVVLCCAALHCRSIDQPVDWAFLHCSVLSIASTGRDIKRRSNPPSVAVLYCIVKQFFDLIVMVLSLVSTDVLLRLLFRSLSRLYMYRHNIHISSPISHLHIYLHNLIQCSRHPYEAPQHPRVFWQCCCLVWRRTDLADFAKIQ